MSDSPFFKDCPPPAPSYFEKNVGLLYENARAFFYALLYAIRILSDFFLTYLSGGALGEARASGGGVTFSEISAIRWLRRNAKPRRQYMVATTRIASGEQMIGSLLRPFENNLTYLDR